MFSSSSARREDQCVPASPTCFSPPGKPSARPCQSRHPLHSVQASFSACRQQAAKYAVFIRHTSWCSLQYSGQLASLLKESFSINLCITLHIQAHRLMPASQKISGAFHFAGCNRRGSQVCSASSDQGRVTKLALSSHTAEHGTQVLHMLDGLTFCP